MLHVGRGWGRIDVEESRIFWEGTFFFGFNLEQGSPNIIFYVFEQLKEAAEIGTTLLCFAESAPLAFLLICSAEKETTLAPW